MVTLTKYFLRSLLAAVFLAALLLLLLGSGTADAKDPVVSLRVYDSGYDAELYLGSLGILYSFFPERVTINSAKYDTQYLFLRYFFKGPQDSFYLGAGARRDRTTNSGVALDSEPILIGGYQWMWDSGFTVDLGFRPGILALGFSF